MRAVKWVLGLLVLAVVGLFLGYVLPKRDVIYVTDAYNRFVEPGELRGVRALSSTDATTATAGARLGADVLFVVGRARDGGLVEFRNEDTGFGFPPYFKFDTATLDNQAREAISTQDAPRWMIARYYGWRVPFLSMFPNLTSMTPAADRNVTLIPWFNIAFLLVVGSLAWAIWVRIVRLFRRRADPVAASWDPAAVRPAPSGWRFWRR